MKILRFVSIIFLGLIVSFLIVANVFYRPLRHWMEMDHSSVSFPSATLKELVKVENQRYLFKIVSEKKLYRPFQPVLMMAYLVDKKGGNVPENAVVELQFFKGNSALANIHGDFKQKLAYDPEKKVWVGYWYPKSRNLFGDIRVKASAFPDTPGSSVETECTLFFSVEKPNVVLKKGRAFIGIDSMTGIVKRRILSPSGNEVDWTAIPEWMQVLSADGILMMGGATQSFIEGTDNGNPWNNSLISDTKRLAEKVHQNQGRFGTWIKVLSVDGRLTKALDYQSSYDLVKNNSQSVARISLRDESRQKEVIHLMKRFAQNSSIDYIGLSDIFGGPDEDMELFEDFIRDYQWPVTSDWKQLTEKQRFSRFLDEMKNQDNLKLYNQWKNYIIAEYIRKLTQGSGTDKAVFYFANLSELKANPEMLDILFNSGVDFVVMNFDIPFMMLDKELSGQLKSALQKYYNRLVVSFELDYKSFHDPKKNKSAIGNYVLANKIILHKISAQYPAQGLMIYDLYRIMPGKRGPYPSNDWMMGIGQSIYNLKQGQFEYGLKADVIMEESNKNIMRISIENISDNPLKNIRLRFIPENFKQDYSLSERTIEVLNEGMTKNFLIPLQSTNENSIFKQKKHFLGLRLTWNENGREKSFVRLIPVQFQGSMMRKEDENQKQE